MSAPPVARRATLAGAAALLLWSTQAALARTAAELPPLQLTAMGFTVGAVMLGVATRAADRDAPPLPAVAWWIGAAGMAGYHVLYFTAFHLAPALEANLLNYLWPLLVVLFAAALPGHALHARHVVGAALGFGGVVALLGVPGRLAWAHAPGLVAAGGAAVVWAGYSVAMRRWPDASPRAVAAWCAFTAVVAALGHVLLEDTVVPTSASTWIAVTVMGAFPLGLAFLGWDRAVRRGDLRGLGAASYVTPVLSTLLLAAAGHVELDHRAGVAVVLVALGAVVARVQ